MRSSKKKTVACVCLHRIEAVCAQSEKQPGNVVTHFGSTRKLSENDRLVLKSCWLRVCFAVKLQIESGNSSAQTVPLALCHVGRIWKMSGPYDWILAVGTRTVESHPDDCSWQVITDQPKQVIVLSSDPEPDVDEL